MIRNNLPAAFGAAVLALSALPAPASEPGNVMHLSVAVKMEMSGTAMNLPSIRKDICVSKKFDARDVVTQSQSRGGCETSGYKFAGDSGSFHYKCNGKMQLEGDGKVQLKPGGGSHVDITTSGNNHGQPISMVMSLDSTPAGASCDYTPPAASN